MDEKKCNGCINGNKMEKVPYVVLELTSAKHDRRERRLWIAIIISILLFFINNAMWLHAWNSYDYSSEEVIYTQDGQGTNIIGDSNEVDDGAKNNNP